MKKKLGLIMVFLGAFLLTSCIEISNVEAIVFESMPKTTYLVGEELEEFEVRIIFIDDTDDLVISSYDSRLDIRGFNTETAGTKTLNVTYESVSVSIVYTVTTLFAGGTGTDADPYQIATAYHFMNIFTQNSDGFYYELVDDIDFSGVSEIQYQSHINNSKINPFKGYISGASDDNKHKIENYSHTYIFGWKIGSSTITHIDFVNIQTAKSIIAYGVLDGAQVMISDISVDETSNAVQGGLFRYLGIPKINTTVSFVNVILRATVTDPNWGAGSLVAHAGSGGKITINVTKTKNYGTIIGSSDKTGAFIGYTSSKTNYEDAENHGDLYFVNNAPTSINPFENNHGTLDFKGININTGNIYILNTYNPNNFGMKNVLTTNTGNINASVEALSNLEFDDDGDLSFDGVTQALYYEVIAQTNVDMYHRSVESPEEFILHSWGYPRTMNSETVQQPLNFGTLDEDEIPNRNVDTMLSRITSVLQKTDLTTVDCLDYNIIQGDPNDVILKADPGALLGLSSSETEYVFDTASSEDIIYLLSPVKEGGVVVVTYRVTAYNAAGIPIASATISDTLS